MSKPRTNKNWAKLQEFQAGNKDLFIIIADPRTDEVSFSYQERFAFVRFPSVDMMDGVVFNALRESKFKEAIDPLIAGISEGTGITPYNKAGNEVLSAIGGAVRSMGIPLKENKADAQVINKKVKTNGKGKK
jgi:hypothetical protein